MHDHSDPAGGIRWKRFLCAAILLPVVVTTVFSIHLVRRENRFQRQGIDGTQNFAYPLSGTKSTLQTIDLNWLFLAPLDSMGLLPESIDRGKIALKAEHPWLRTGSAVGCVAAGWFFLGWWIDRVRSGHVLLKSASKVRIFLRLFLFLGGVIWTVFLIHAIQPGFEGPNYSSTVLVVPAILFFLAWCELGLLGWPSGSYLPALGAACSVAAVVVLNYHPMGNSFFWDDILGFNSPTLAIVIPGMLVRRWTNTAIGIPNSTWSDPVVLFAIPAALYWFMIVRFLLTPWETTEWFPDTARGLVRAFAGMVLAWSYFSWLLSDEDQVGFHFWSTCSSALFFLAFRRNTTGSARNLLHEVRSDDLHP